MEAERRRAEKEKEKGCADIQAELAASKVRIEIRRIRLMPGLRKEKEKLLILNKPVKPKHLPNRQCRKLRLPDCSRKWKHSVPS